MRVLFVGATSPPGGENARRFGVAAGRRSALGDEVEVHAPGRLSVAHVALSSRKGAMLRDLKANPERFEAVVVRIESARPVRLETRGVVRGRAVSQLRRALDGYSEITLMLDPGSPLLRALGDDAVRDLFDRATCLVVAKESEREAIAATHPAQAIKCSIAQELSRHADLRHARAEEASSEMWADAQGQIRRRSVRGPSHNGLLVDPPGRARPSLAGSTMWLLRRVIGKTRGAVTKLLRP